MSVVRGALGPLLEKTIKEQLNYEHRVLEGKAERTTVRIHCMIICQYLSNMLYCDEDD